MSNVDVHIQKCNHVTVFTVRLLHGMSDQRRKKRKYIPSSATKSSAITISTSAASFKLPLHTQGWFITLHKGKEPQGIRFLLQSLESVFLSSLFSIF